MAIIACWTFFWSWESWAGISLSNFLARVSMIMLESAISSPFISTKGSIPFLDRNLLLWSIFWYWTPWIFSQDSSFYGFFFFLLTVLILELHLMLSLILSSSSFNLMICCLQITYVLQILREKAQIIRFQLNHLKELLFMWLYFHCYDKHPK